MSAARERRPASWAVAAGTMLLAAVALRPLIAQPEAAPNMSPIATAACRQVLDALEGGEGLAAHLTYGDIQIAYALLEDDEVATEWERIAQSNPTNLVASNLRTAFGRVRYLFHESFGDCASRAVDERVARTDSQVHVLNRTIDLQRRALASLASLPQ